MFKLSNKLFNILIIQLNTKFNYNQLATILFMHKNKHILYNQFWNLSNKTLSFNETFFKENFLFLSTHNKVIY